MHARPLALALCCALASSIAAAQGPDKKETFGAVVGPAALPSGSTATYFYVGAPEVGGGYRQGIELLEIEARASFDYLDVALAAEALVRLPVLRGGRIELAPTVGFGLVYDFGARYYNRINVAYFGLRPRAGAVASFLVSDTVRGVLQLDVPWTFVPAGGMRVTPLVGGGAEIYLAEDMTALVLGQIGVDVFKIPVLAVTQTPPAWRVQFGIGFRQF